jgi:SSS family solute:Na+ symporter
VNRVHAIDYAICVLYVLMVAGIGLWVARRKKTTTDDYFLADRKLPSWLVGFTIIGTVISSVSFVAHPGAAYAQNWRLIAPNLMVPFVLIFVVLVVVPFYRRVVRMSSYEYLEQRFGPAARLYGASGFVLLRVVDLGFTMLLTAIAVEVITGWDIKIVIFSIGLLTVCYTVVGGLEAVIWTDVVQGVVLGAGALTILGIVLFVPPGGPMAVIRTAAENGKFSLGSFDYSWKAWFGDQPTFWLMAVSGFFHFGRSYVTEPNMVQRYLVARTDREAQRGVLAGAFACVPIWLTFAFIGSCMWAFYQLMATTLPPDIAAKPDNVLPYFVATQLPPGLVGLVVAAIFSAANSNVSSDLNSVATVLTSDFFTRARPTSSERARLAFGRFSVLAGGIAATIVALVLMSSRARAMIELVITLGMVFSGGMLGLFGLGFVSRRATRRGAYVGIGVTVTFILWALVTGPLGINLGLNFRLHPIMIGIISHPLLFIVGYVSSLALGGYRPELKGLTAWDLPSAAEPTPALATERS